METEIQKFILYLHNIKNTSKNTELSYRRDILKFRKYFAGLGIEDVALISENRLKEYIDFLENSKLSAATVSRNIASIKAYYHYLEEKGVVNKDISDVLKAPKIEKKLPDILSAEEVVKLLEQPKGHTEKEVRDKAMLELLYATGIRVTELITLKISDVNLSVGFILCRDAHKERIIPFGKEAKKAMKEYIENVRGKMMEDDSSDILFVNCTQREQELLQILPLIL